MRMGLLGCKGTTLDLLQDVTQRKCFSFDHVFTLPAAQALKNDVVFYRGDQIIAFCESKGISVNRVARYTLRGEEDFALFRQAAIDLLVVIGWERLIPETILGVLGRFACGMHGSAFGLPRGRGRSPLNWSLITGQSQFATSLFRYTPSTDSGDIIGTLVFDINEHDSIETLHMKNRIAMRQLLQRYVPLIASGEIMFEPQPEQGSSYYPKRRPEDGAIDWRRSTEEIFNLVRAVAPPYPGAFTFLNERKLEIHAAQPFDTHLFDDSCKKGEILDVSVAGNKFVIKTGSGSLLVTNFSGAAISELAVGEVLRSADWQAQIAEIRTRYPEGTPASQQEI